VLLDAGHREGVCLIGAGPRLRDGPADSVAAVERLIGIRETGLKIAGARACAEWQPEEGLAATQSLLAEHRPKALICLNDRLALGAYQALNDAGFSVPDDVSVVSFDDHPIASWMRPKLTTVALPHYELGRKAVEVLFAQMGEEGEPGQVHRVAMPVRHRESVKPR
jgi:LacI family transcriptional regulator